MSAYSEQSWVEWKAWYEKHYTSNPTERKVRMPYSAGDKVIVISNNERATVNWEKDGEVGITYTDEPWHPGSMVLNVRDIMADEWSTEPPKRYAKPTERVAAVREQLEQKHPTMTMGEAFNAQLDDKDVDADLRRILGG